MQPQIGRIAVCEVRTLRCAVANSFRAQHHRSRPATTKRQLRDSRFGRCVTANCYRQQYRSVVVPCTFEIRLHTFTRLAVHSRRSAVLGHLLIVFAPNLVPRNPARNARDRGEQCRSLALHQLLRATAPFRTSRPVSRLQCTRNQTATAYCCRAGVWVDVDFVFRWVARVSFNFALPKVIAWRSGQFRQQIIWAGFSSKFCCHIATG
ncbi:hypothetical protein EV126DRAFT_221079 [Verticillium dahliae]|nr:hypothetical protein EV126DRAFT_146331 [Verticillium dahliae]KAH6702156.1 hypothetical protein EV126DRAFT_221079 [Verticillium dahliae]